MVLAKQIANHSRSSLIAFKHQLTYHLHKQLEETYKLELAMHEKTFVGQSDTLKQINDNFIQESSSSHSETNNDEKFASPEAAVASQDMDILPAVMASIKRLLAEELHMQEHEIDENTQFVDLGLDSISGVAWMRKINEKYKTSIEAIKVYSYSTLTKLSRFVKEEAEKKGKLSNRSDFIQQSMHEKTFVGQFDALKQNSENFIQESASSHSKTNNDEKSLPDGAVVSSQDTDILSAITASIKKLLAEELHMQEHEIDENTQFIDLGLDSISGVAWMRKINEKYKTSIEAIKVYSYSTLTKLSRFVKEEAEKKGTLSNKSEFSRPVIPVDITAVAQNRNVSQFAVRKLVSWRNKQSSRINHDESSFTQSQPIAVIGMAGQFPQAKNLEEFWQNIAQGKNCINEIPQKRWDINTFYHEGNAVPGKTNCKWTGALEEYDLFDPLFFNISPTEAESMDPQQRVFLQACWHTIEDAGYNAKSLSGSRCGVFAGCGQGDYRLLSRDLQISALGFTGGDTSILAARIAYFLNLQGPCISIETACSSSLVAIANACDSLVSGNSDLALAGGVYVMTGPEVHIKSSQTGMLSPDGRCSTFDQQANGFVPGEGVGVVMLKRLADAERDHDIILSVIQGWGVNQDGKTNGITAPNPESQTRLEQEVYDKYQIDPESIQLIEAHGTGTKLGDPIEVDALQQSFKKYTRKKDYCALGSVKSNIGHCLTAAGVASFIKVVLALKHKQLPPTINFGQLNEHISLKDSPFYINNQLQAWELKGAQKRQAAISAFGFSGTNSHIVLAEYLPPIDTKQPVSVITQNGKIIIPLSAKNEAQLKQKASDLLDFIHMDQALDLIEVAYTLQVGREEMEERLGFMVSKIDQLAEKLQAYTEGKEKIGDAYFGHVKSNKTDLQIIQDDDMKETIIGKWMTQKKLSKLLDLWTKGLELDWNRFYGEVKPQRVALPVYPFAKERYWIDALETMQVSKKGAMNFVLHPLLHINTSNLREQSYRSIFTGEELFLKDHQVNGQKILPAVAYLEMARVAVENALPTKPESSILELYNTVWMKPIGVAENKEVTIALYVNDANGSLNERIDYEIYTTDADQEILHCQGQAAFSSNPKPAKLDIEQLKRQMKQGKLEQRSIYEIFTKMGLSYGPAHQGVISVFQGEKQLLAQLRLPVVAESGLNDYLLHPSLMDCALQSSIGLIAGLRYGPNKPLLPFTLDFLRVVSACVKEMFAWVRYSSDSKPEDKIMKLDIDLCDLDGNVCVQMKGFISRFLEGEINTQRGTINNSIRNNTGLMENSSSFDDGYYQKLIDSVLSNKVTVDEAVELG
jgi:acyl transferase domain-containing protein/acyl carrier protein